jgi:hypothetical protein
MKDILYYIALNTRISEIITIHCSKVLELTMILTERLLTLRIYSKQNKYANYRSWVWRVIQILGLESNTGPGLGE